MIIDSHAHYSRYNFEQSFRYLSYENGSIAVKEGTRDKILQALPENGITGIIEPGVYLESNEKLLNLSKLRSGFIFPAVGVHPTRVFHLKLKDREKIEAYASDKDVIAIGETGLDYHYKRLKQHRLKQFFWFRYQIDLADKYELPLILHIRQAYLDATRVLEKKKEKLHGGIVHCFCGTSQQAQNLIELGYYIGIGGALLQSGEIAGRLTEVVRNIPLNRILVETDAPYVLPDFSDDTISKKARRKIRNTSLILPRVIQCIAEIKKSV